MQIIRAKPEDAEVLTEIAYAAKRHWGYPARWIETWRDTLTIRAEFVAAHVAWSAMEDLRAVGFYVLTSKQDGLHLDHLWVVPSAMGRGVGRALFEHAVQQARALGKRVLKIESDPNAEGFYKRMGAYRVGEAVTEIDGHRRKLPVLLYELPEAGK